MIEREADVSFDPSGRPDDSEAFKAYRRAGRFALDGRFEVIHDPPPDRAKCQDSKRLGLVVRSGSEAAPEQSIADTAEPVEKLKKILDNCSWREYCPVEGPISITYLVANLKRRTPFSRVNPRIQAAPIPRGRGLLMPWNPLGFIPLEHRRLVWVVLATLAVCLRGPMLWEMARGIPRMSTNDGYVLPDFFQEYASSKNYFDGVDIYNNQSDSIRSLIYANLDEKSLMFEFNAHPPSAVLVSMPLAGLGFNEAMLTWNILSLLAFASGIWLIIANLELPCSPWSFVPIIALSLFFNPLIEQIGQGQLSAIIMALVTGAWAAERCGRPSRAGVLIGFASAIKLFPGFLILYYAWRREWKIVRSAVATLAVVTAVTALILGLDAYVNYVVRVLPNVAWFRAGWNNASLSGFWSRLLDPVPEKARAIYLTIPLVYMPALCKAMTLVSSLAVVGFVAWSTRAGRSHNALPPLRESDYSFAMAVTAMLLISPITWEHYFLILAVPLAILWLGMPQSPVHVVVFVAILAVIGCDTRSYFSKNIVVAKPMHSLTILSNHTYCLLAILATLGTRVAKVVRPRVFAERGATRIATMGGFVVVSTMVAGCVDSRIATSHGEAVTGIATVEVLPSVVLGEIRAGQIASGELIYSNKTEEVVVIETVESTCPCIKVSPLPQTVEIGGTARLRVKFDPTEDPKFRGSLSVGLIAKGHEGRNLLRTRVELDVSDNPTNSSLLVKPARRSGDRP